MSGGDWKEMLVAVQDGDIDLVKYHIEKGVDVNYEHPELMTTALIESVNYDRYQIAEYLLENGADPDQKAWISTDTALTVARSSKKREFVNLMRPYAKRSNLMLKIMRVLKAH